MNSSHENSLSRDSDCSLHLDDDAKPSTVTSYTQLGVSDISDITSTDSSIIQTTQKSTKYTDLNRFGNTDLSRISKSIKETKRAIGASAESSESKRKRSHINARMLSLEKEIERDDTNIFDLFQFMMMAREE
jgi:hypothetical protein